MKWNSFRKNETNLKINGVMTLKRQKHGAVACHGTFIVYTLGDCDQNIK